jgi:hypothetical protein
MSEEEVKKFLEKGNFSAADFRLFNHAQQEIDEFREKAIPKPKMKHHEKWGKKI